MTALRLVQRMKRDSIHSGRRPSGVCGAALLIAARLHDFSRTTADVVRIVKIHESTLRKRLIEFGETPSSALTPDEFMTVDLEEEQDPPAFKAARKRDKDRLQKLMEEEDGEKELTDLQRDIEAQLDKDTTRRKKTNMISSPTTHLFGLDEGSSEDAEASRFATEDTLSLIGEIAKDVQPRENTNTKNELEKGLGPELVVIGLGQQEDKSDTFVKPESKHYLNKDLHNAEDLHLSHQDEEYINSLIMTEEEAKHKTVLWHNINADYLKEQKIKEEIRAREKEEGKDKKKKVRGSYKKKVACNAATAGEAIGKMLAEKKMSSKINYDILKTLDQPGITASPITPVQAAPSEIESVMSTVVETAPTSPVPRKRKKKAVPTFNVVPSRPAPASPAPATPATPATPDTPAPPTPQAQDADDYDEDLEADVTDGNEQLSLAAMLKNGDEEDYYDYDEY
ncbi:unnamed protein product [Euphydryas editha]|uniref:Transcription factor IIIB 90 kDa subunit n=1 Tax=Euphydryas editha TaxID=104508 RepID=A0AAU9U6E4_EUPED|nr:unnamed protein product [Euphydryas editha]